MPVAESPTIMSLNMASLTPEVLRLVVMGDKLLILLYYGLNYIFDVGENKYFFPEFKIKNPLKLSV